MPKKTFQIIVSGQPAQLTVEWRGIFNKLTVKENEKTLGTFENFKELKAGREFSLSDDSSLKVRLKQSGFMQELEVLHAGVPVPGSDGAPETKIKTAAAIVLLLAAINALAGAAGLFFPLPAAIGLGVYNLLLMPIYVFAAVLIRRNSFVGLALAIGVFAGDAVMASVTQYRLGMNTAPTWIIVRIFLLIPMIQAISPMQSLRRKKILTNGQ